MHKIVLQKLFVPLTLLVLMVPQSAWTQDRGKMLYQNHCIACHESRVHIRERKKAKDYEDIEKFAARFGTIAGVEWNDADMAAVVEYLNRKYYKFDR